MNETGSHSKAGELNLRLLTPDEVAALLRISKTGVYRLVERRTVRFYRISGVLRFDQNDIEAFIRQGCVEPIQ
jgi:excisionase family DNA binding protein